MKHPEEKYIAYTEVTEDNYKEIVLQIERIGDDKNFSNNDKLQLLFEKLCKLISDYDDIHYPINPQKKLSCNMNKNEVINEILKTAYKAVPKKCSLDGNKLIDIHNEIGGILDKFALNSVSSNQVINCDKSLFKGSYSDIEKIASNSAKKIGKKIDKTQLTTNQYLCEIVKTLGGKIETVIESDDGLGFTNDAVSLIIHTDKSFVIKLSKYSCMYRDNFVIAHALGHLLLHYPLKEKVKNDVSFYWMEKKEFEWQANRFAASFLMPKKTFLSKCKEFKKDSYLISAFFEVPESTVIERLKYV